MSKYFPPGFEETSFTCVHCGVFAEQHWQALRRFVGGGALQSTSITECLCNHCQQYSYWF